VSTTRIDPASLPGRPCAMAAALQLVGERWAMLAVREVVLGNHRFTEIARNTGAPTDRLTTRLRELVAAGILERRPLEERGGRAGYFLTAAGRDLAPVIQGLISWGNEWAVSSPTRQLRHRDHDLVPAVVCTSCGEVVDDAEVALRDDAAASSEGSGSRIEDGSGSL
jgi:DNA-binding HxlR family transcriptional regulator